MKFLNIIKLLSVLLCVFALFVSCDFIKGNANPETSEQETTAPAETEEETRGEVEPILENFFTFSKTDSWIELGEAKRLDGTCVSTSYQNEIIVLRSAEVDTQNIVTETFKVYNTVLQKVVLTVENQYDYDSYSAFDWGDIYVDDENVEYPESVMKVEAIDVNNFIFIKVSRATVTPTPEEVLEENEDAFFYSIDISSEFYDVAGKKITDAKYNTTPYYNYNSRNGSVARFEIGSVNAFLNADTMELIKTVNADNETAIAGYHGESEKYGYFFSTHYTALSSCVQYFELYDKASDTCTYSHYFDPATQISMFVLENGNLFIQIVNVINADTALPYDFESNGEKYSLESYIFNAKDQSMTEIECNYLVSKLSQVTEDMSDYYGSMGITLTDNVDQLALAAFIEDGKIDKYQIAVIDNKAQVLFALDRIIPEHNVDMYDFGFKILDENNYLVDLHDVVTSKAIVSKDGKVRCYLNDGDIVVGNYVVNEKGIFDFDMNLLYEFDDEEYTLAATVGDSIVISKIVEVFDEEEEDQNNNNNIFFPDEETTVETGTETGEEPEPDEEYVEYYVFKSAADDEVVADLFYGADDRMSLVSSDDDYLIFRNSENGKYYLYNAKLEHVLTTQYEMSLYLCEDNYIVFTYLYVNGTYTPILYTVSSSLAG